MGSPNQRTNQALAKCLGAVHYNSCIANIWPGFYFQDTREICKICFFQWKWSLFCHHKIRCYYLIIIINIYNYNHNHHQSELEKISYCEAPQIMGAYWDSKIPRFTNSLVRWIVLLWKIMCFDCKRQAQQLINRWQWSCTIHNNPCSI